MEFTIKELETLSGIKAHTIRIWEQRYQFLKPSRTITNIRVYSNEELKTLLTVALLNKYGYKISKIDGMTQELRNAELLRLPETEAQTEYLVNELLGCMVDLEIDRFEEILDQYVEKHGIVESMTGLLFRFLDKTGILWQTGRINPAHEHIVSNIIRQKLLAALETLPSQTRKKPLLLLLLPEGAHHELGLLFVSYLLKQRGLSFIYVGANVPLKDAGYVVNIKKPKYVYLHITSIPVKLNFQKFVHTLSTNHPASTVLLSGNIPDGISKNLPLNVRLLQSLPHVVAYISEL